MNGFQRKGLLVRVDTLLRATNQPLSALLDVSSEISQEIGTWYPMSNQVENLFNLVELGMSELLSRCHRPIFIIIEV